MSTLLQRLQAKIEEFQRQNTNAEITADVEAEIMQKLAEERLPKNTVIEAKKTSSEKDTDGNEPAESTNVFQPAGNAGHKESSVKASEDLQQQEDSASKDSKDDSANFEQKVGSDETPAHKSVPDGGKDDGEQQRSDIPADEQDEILENSALRPGLATKESQMATDQQQDSTDDKNKDQLQSAPSQQDNSEVVAGAAEVKAEGDNDDSIKPRDLDGLKGLEVNANGMIYDKQGNPVARLVEGDCDELAGWTVGEKGEILDDDGDLIGTVELVKHGRGQDDSAETVVQESANEDKKKDVQQAEAGGLDTDRGKDEAIMATPNSDADARQAAGKESDGAPQVDADVEQTTDEAAGESQRVDAKVEEASDEAGREASPVEAEVEQDVNQAGVISQQEDADVEQVAGEAASESQQVPADAETTKEASGNLPEADADVGQNVGEGPADSQKADDSVEETSKGATGEKDTNEAADNSPKADAATEQTVDEDLGGANQADATDQQTPKKGVSGRKPPRKLQSKSKAQGVDRNQHAENNDGKDLQIQGTTDAANIDSVGEPNNKDDDNSAQRTEEVKQQDPDQQASGGAVSSEGDPKNESPEQKDLEERAQPVTPQDERQNTDTETRPDQNSGQSKNAGRSETPVKSSENDGHDAPEELERQDSVVQDTSESKEKQNKIIGDSQEVRPHPVEGEEGDSEKQDEQSKDNQQTDIKDELNAQSGEQDDTEENETANKDDKEPEESDTKEGEEENDDGTGKNVGDAAAKVAQLDGKQADGQKVDEQEVKKSQAAEESGGKEGFEESSGVDTAKKEDAEQSEQQTSKARPSDEAHDAMDTHNKARQDKGTQALRWDDELASEAAKFAQKLSKSRKYQHSGVEEHGENVFVGIEDVSYEQAVQSWLAEETEYDGDKFGEGNVAKYARFTQCMWHNSSHFGIAKATSKHGGTYVVARYWPQGNIVGEKPY